MKETIPESTPHQGKTKLDLGFFQIARRAALRQLVFVVATLDFALVLLFTIMADWNEYPTFSEWWDNMVLQPLPNGFSYTRLSWE